MRAPISCVFLKRAPTSDSNGRLLTVKPYDFVADLEQCENVIEQGLILDRLAEQQQRLLTPLHREACLP
ncbi:MAG TPA: hypothetical protein VFA04_08295 [Bryobacteraceae bacterium]|nr:hypothetical protein [Bryobacteraceae bacterium]